MSFGDTQDRGYPGNGAGADAAGGDPRGGRDAAVIECDGLTRRFGDFTAVDRVGFRVPRRAIFGFLGPNGSGKSTVIRMLCGILAPSAGRATVGGADVDRHPEALRGVVGYMSQKFSLYNELTVRENLVFYGRLYGLWGRALRARQDELVEMMHLAPYLGRRAALLSGGWRQRLAMACAMVHRPEVLFLDEPTAGIDPVARRELWDMLFALAGGGMTLFVSTHYMDEAERCSQVGYIYLSRLIACGAPDELKALPEVNPPGARRIEVACDHVTEALRAVRHLPGIRGATVFGSSMHLLAGDELDDGAIRSALRGAGVGEASFRPIAASLEDVFVEMTARQAVAAEGAR